MDTAQAVETLHEDVRALRMRLVALSKSQRLFARESRIDLDELRSLIQFAHELRGQLRGLGIDALVERAHAASGERGLRTKHAGAERRLARARSLVGRDEKKADHELEAILHALAELVSETRTLEGRREDPAHLHQEIQHLMLHLSRELERFDKLLERLTHELERTRHPAD